MLPILVACCSNTQEMTPEPATAIAFVKEADCARVSWHSSVSEAFQLNAGFQYEINVACTYSDAAYAGGRAIALADWAGTPQAPNLAAFDWPDDTDWPDLIALPVPIVRVGFWRRCF